MNAKAHPRPFARAFRRWWWMIVLVTLVAGTVAYVVSSRARAVYEAEVVLLVGPVSADADTQSAAGTLAATYTQLVTSKPVLDATSKALGAANDDEYAWGATGARANQTLRTLMITVQSDEPELAAQIANTIATNLSNLVEGTVSTSEVGRLTVIEPAVPPKSPVEPNPTTDVAFAALAGLCASIAVAVFVEATRRVGGRRRPVLADRPDSQPRTP